MPPTPLKQHEMPQHKKSRNTSSQSVAATTTAASNTNSNNNNSKNATRSERKCFRCHKVGHDIKDCPLPAKQGRGGTRGSTSAAAITESVNRTSQEQKGQEDALREQIQDLKVELLETKAPEPAPGVGSELPSEEAEVIRVPAWVKRLAVPALNPEVFTSEPEITVTRSDVEVDTINDGFFKTVTDGLSVNHKESYRWYTLAPIWLVWLLLWASTYHSMAYGIFTWWVINLTTWTAWWFVKAMCIRRKADYRNPCSVLHAFIAWAEFKHHFPPLSLCLSLSTAKRDMSHKHPNDVSYVDEGYTGSLAWADMRTDIQKTGVLHHNDPLYFDINIEVHVLHPFSILRLLGNYIWDMGYDDSITHSIPTTELGEVMGDYFDMWGVGFESFFHGYEPNDFSMSEFRREYNHPDKWEYWDYVHYPDWVYYSGVIPSLDDDAYRDLEVGIDPDARSSCSSCGFDYEADHQWDRDTDDELEMDEIIASIIEDVSYDVELGLSDDEIEIESDSDSEPETEVLLRRRFVDRAQAVPDFYDLRDELDIDAEEAEHPRYVFNVRRAFRIQFQWFLMMLYADLNAAVAGLFQLTRCFCDAASLRIHGFVSTLVDLIAKCLCFLFDAFCWVVERPGYFGCLVYDCWAWCRSQAHSIRRNFPATAFNLGVWVYLATLACFDKITLLHSVYRKHLRAMDRISLDDYIVRTDCTLLGSFEMVMQLAGDTKYIVMDDDVNLSRTWTNVWNAATYTYSINTSRAIIEQNVARNSAKIALGIIARSMNSRHHYFGNSSHHF